MIKILFVTLFVLALAVNGFAHPTPPTATIAIDAYSGKGTEDTVGFFLYHQKGKGCSLLLWDDTKTIDIGMPTNLTADGLQNYWAIDPLWGLKATNCVQLTAFDAAGNESAFATVVVTGDNVGWFGIARGKGIKSK